jgi:hypothetical protein
MVDLLDFQTFNIKNHFEDKPSIITTIENETREIIAKHPNAPLPAFALTRSEFMAYHEAQQQGWQPLAEWQGRTVSIPVRRMYI